MQQSTGTSTSHNSEALNQDPEKTVALAGPITPGQKTTPVQTSVPVTVATPELVSDADPILPQDPYPVQHAARINETPLTSHHMRYADATRTFVLRGNSTGLIINATKLEGPLWISFDVKPIYDCLEDPESCRGDNEKTISRPFFMLTVRNNQTREIVAEDGYGGVYSSQKDNRTIKIYGEGWYHLTLTGNSVDVTLAIATGTAPVVSVTQPPAAVSSQKKMIPPEVLQRLREGG